MAMLKAGLALLIIIVPVLAIPQRAQRPARLSIASPVQGRTAPDGSIIVDKQIVIDGLTLRYKVSAPASSLVDNSINRADPATTKLGINLLLHGDGGASFEAFPNKNTQDGLMGVVLLAPNDALLWGGQSTATVQRPDGVAHAKAIDTFIREELPRTVDFDMANVWFTGVSGGSLLLSGFFAPMFLSKYKTGMMLMCGGMSPPTTRAGFVNTLDAETITKSRIHWQSTQQELASLKVSIPAGIEYYESFARGTGGMSDSEIDSKQTADATPKAGHCAFDSAGFNSGIELVSASWSRVMRSNATTDMAGTVKGIGMVAKGVVGREKLYAK